MDEDEVEPKRGWLVRTLDNVSTRRWITIAGALVLAFTGLFGGLATAAPETLELPTLAVGETHVGAQFSVAVHDASLMEIAPGYSFEADDGKEYLVITATITNNDVATTILIDDAIALEWLDAEDVQVDRTVVVSDSSTLAQVHPGLPVDVAFVWQVPRGSVSAGDDVRVSVMQASLRTDSELSFGQYWYDPVPVAHVNVPTTRIAPVGDSE